MAYNGVQIENSPNIIVITDSDANQITVTQPITRTVEVTALGPQGPVGPQGPTGSMAESNSGSFSITGSLTVSGSSTFTNIGPAIFSGSVSISGSALYNGKEILTTAISGGFVTTSSFNSFTSSINSFTASYKLDSASFDTRILSNSSSIASLSGSYLASSASFNTRILNNSASISSLSASFLTFSGSYNTGSFTGSFSGVSNLTSLTSSNALVTGNVTVLGTASINTLIVNQTQLSTGSNQLGDNVDDFQTLYGTVRIPTGSLSVTGSVTFVTPNIPGNGVLIQSLANQPLLILAQAGGAARGQLSVTGGSQELYNFISNVSTGQFNWYNNTTNQLMKLYSNGNLVLQNGGTFTDAGYRLDISGSTRVNGELTVGDGTNSIIKANSAASGNFNTIQLVANTTNYSTMFEIRPNGTSTDLTGFLLRDSSTAAANSNVVLIGRGNATLPNTGVSYYGSLVANNANANSLHLGFLVSNVSLGRIEAARIWNSGNVSIQNGGTFTDAGYRLDVKGSTRIQGTGTTSSTTALRVENSNASASLVIRDDGFVGIGTTGPGYNLDVSGSIRATSYVHANDALVSNSLVSTGNADLVLNKTTAYSILLNTTGVERMRVNAAGNVGIGITSPTAKLDISGSIRSEIESDGNFITLQATSQRRHFIKRAGQILQFTSDAATTYDVRFDSSNSSVYILSGSVGIGTTTPGVQLDVVGSIRANSTVFSSTVQTNNIQTNGQNLTILGAGGTAGLTMNQTTRQFGIGTTTPSASLHISGSSGSVLLEVDSDSTQNILYVSGSGNIGIGTNSPTTKLHIVQTSAPSTRETLMKFSVSDAGNDAFFIGNGTSIDSTFWPAFAGFGSSTTRSGIQFIGYLPSSADASDSSDRGILNFEALRTSNSTDPLNGTLTAIQNRKLFTFSDLTGPFVSMYPSRNIAIGTAFIPSAAVHISGASTANLLRIDSPTTSSILFVSGSGRVGIGTSNPTGSLHIIDAGTGATISLQVNSVFRVTGDGQTRWGSAMNQGLITWDTGRVMVGGLAGSNLDLTAGAATRARLDTSGNMGIGTALGTISARTHIIGSGATSATTALLIQNSTPTTLLTIRDDGNASFNGNTQITGSLAISASAGTGSAFSVYKSGSTVMSIQGSQGELFSITDSLSGSLFSVSNISGLPILEVFSDNTVLLGSYLDPMLMTTQRVTANSGSTVIYSLPTSSYDGVFVDYVIRSGSNARAGQFMGMWSGSTTTYTDNSTTDFGSTSGFIFGLIISGSNMVLTGSASTSGWTVRAGIRSI